MVSKGYSSENSIMKGAWKIMKTTIKTSESRRHFAAVTLGESLFVFGGTTRDGAVSRDVKVYDDQLRSWSSVPPMCYPR